MNKKFAYTLPYILAIPVFIWFHFKHTPLPFNINNIMTYLIVAPLFEELVFRGVLQEYIMRKFGLKHSANLIVSTLFTLAHILLRGFNTASVFFPSMVIGWHYSLFRNIIYVIILHAVYNLVVFI